MNSSTNPTFQNCPFLGVGLGLREPIRAEIMASRESIDWLEFVPENYMGKGGLIKQQLAQTKSLFPLVSHCVSLSLGSYEPFNEETLQELEELFEWVSPPWFSEHLAFSSFQGWVFNDILPLPRTEETIQYIVDRIKQLQDRFQRPFLIENLAQHLQCPMDTMTEAEFYTEVLEKADCGFLLDISNVYINSWNQKFNPLSFLENIPLERVVQIHIAGYAASDTFPEILRDTHGSAISAPVWELLAWVLKRANPCGILLERDQNFPPFQEILNELQQIRSLWIESGKYQLLPVLSGREALYAS